MMMLVPAKECQYNEYSGTLREPAENSEYSELGEQARL